MTIAPSSFVIGQAVTFQTAGRHGHGQVRTGTVSEIVHTAKGIWIAVTDDAGETAKTRASLVASA